MEKRNWWELGSLEWSDAVNMQLRHLERLGILFDVAKKESFAFRLQREPGQTALADLMRMGFLVENGADGYPYSITEAGHEYASAVEAGGQLSMAAHRSFHGTRNAWADIHKALSRATGYRDDEWMPDNAEEILYNMAEERMADLDAQERVNRRLLRRLSNLESKFRAVLGIQAGDKSVAETLASKLLDRLRDNPAERASAREEARVAYWRARMHMEEDRAACISFGRDEKDKENLERSKRRFSDSVKEVERTHEEFLALGHPRSEL